VRSLLLARVIVVGLVVGLFALALLESGIGPLLWLQIATR
jgi:hypothetical protein